MKTSVFQNCVILIQYLLIGNIAVECKVDSKLCGHGIYTFTVGKELKKELMDHIKRIGKGTDHTAIGVNNCYIKRESSRKRPSK